MINALKGYLGICRKANYLVIGSDNLKSFKKKLYLVIVNKEYSMGVQKIFENLYKNYNMPIISLVNENLGELISIENCQIVAIRNKGLSDKILSLETEYKVER